MMATMGLFKSAVQHEPLPFDPDRPASGAMGKEATAHTLLGEDWFASMLYLERRRCERAQKRFMLMLVDVREAIADGQKFRTLQKITDTLSEITRETDIIGWYMEERLIGVLGTEIGTAKPKHIQERLSEKLRKAFLETLGPERTSQIFTSFHFFPEEWEGGNPGSSANITLYPELARQRSSKRFAMGLKRAIDIIGSAAALTLLSPLCGIIALGIKLTSRGPALFRQERLGLHGKKFTVLKFRSMRTDCDSRVHQEYVSKFIAGQVRDDNSEGSRAVFKILKDPRITPIGQFLRKTSLDELPQFWNVLVGDMSLVGPRPPIEYEFKAYDMWHRRRVTEIKPGITGLWQVEGRSRTQFDDMVRLDLKYARTWTIWLDLKILLQTPAAIVSGDGAH
jgi:lipopolysaccharide/colanic/teichoic acid biosynthesis glycosyltransferase